MGRVGFRTNTPAWFTQEGHRKKQPPRQGSPTATFNYSSDDGERGLNTLVVCVLCVVVGPGLPAALLLAAVAAATVSAGEKATYQGHLTAVRVSHT